MICKKCGRKLKSNEVFCTECGYYNNEEDEELEENEEEYSDEVYEELTFDDDEVVLEEKEEKEESEESEENYEELDDDSPTIIDNLVKAYIGEDYKSIKNNIMNIMALFLSWLYCIYRKLYLIGILGMILTGIVIKYFYKYLIIYIVVTMLFNGITFNTLYLMIIKRRVNKLKEKCTSYKEQKELCEKKGGVNVLLPLLVFALFLAVMLITSFKTIDNKDRFFKENSENQANCKTMSKQAYNILKSTEIEGEITEAACKIETNNKEKSYNIYFKMRDIMGDKYLYFENVDKKLTLLGNTEYISELESKEKDKTITEEEKVVLSNSNNLKEKYEQLIGNSDYEKRLIDNGTNTKSRENYIFTKKDITD